MSKPIYSFYPKPYNILYKEFNFDMPEHMHNEIELVLCIEGLNSILANSRLYNISKNSLIFFPTNCVHKVISDNSEIYKRYVLTISPTWLRNILGRDNKLTIINNIIPIVSALNYDDFLKLKNVFDNYFFNKDNELKRTSILFTILETCEKLLKNEFQFDNSPISEMVQYIDSNLTLKLKVSDIANVFFLNPDYLCRLFKRHTNMTINEYINMQRVSLARELLDCGETIQNVQSKTGYNNYSHFSRVFKRLVHETPKQYQTRKYYFDTVN